jgi:hypothetical protein
MKYLSFLAATAFMVSVLDKKDETGFSNSNQTDITGKYRTLSCECSSPAAFSEPFIEADTAADGILIGNIGYLPVAANVNRQQASLELDTFIYGYDEITGSGSFSGDTLTLMLHHEPAGFAPAGRDAFDCATVLVKNMD